MGRLSLQIRATLENLAGIKITPDSDWNFKVKCTNCQELSDNVIYFNLVEKVEIQGSRGTASFIYKCKNCGRSGNIDYVENSLGKYMAEHSEQWLTIATFECRGLEPAEFFPGTSFSALSSASDTMFGAEGGRDPIDLSDGDWADYDEDGEESVGIYEFSSQFVAAKK
eukprot:Macronucleus_4492.p1 GENE.Macronucleus_4492~~Macronucleus_4492.p1  ORF type:complete len:168 (+),score=33.81 Macronucleus_4492:1-504(+)